MLRLSQLEGGVTKDLLEASLSYFGKIELLDLDNNLAFIQFSTQEQAEECFATLKREGYDINWMEEGLVQKDRNSGMGSSKVGTDFEPSIGDLVGVVDPYLKMSNCTELHTPSPGCRVYSNSEPGDKVFLMAKGHEKEKTITQSQSDSPFEIFNRGRAVLVTGLPRGTTRVQVKQLLSGYGGFLKRMRLHNEGQCCFLDFVLCEDAAKFLHAFKHGYCQVRWSQFPAVLPATEGAKGVEGA
jgi:hypothetical protein